MTKPARDANMLRPGFLLAALVAALVTLFGAGTASAAAVTAAQTRVGAHTLVTQVAVGPHIGVGAGQRLGNDLPAYDSALATGVSAKSAHAVPIGPGPANAWRTLDRVTEKGSPLPGFKGGSEFKNSQGRLPGADGSGSPLRFREWDVNVNLKGVDRGTERLVTGSDGSAFFTRDHYGSFVQIR